MFSAKALAFLSISCLAKNFLCLLELKLGLCKYLQVWNFNIEEKKNKSL